MTNKYLEKIALNAQKARALANQAGILPSSHASWKYALRNVRKGDGTLLAGKALQDKKIQLGDIGNNAYQKLKSVDRDLGSRGVEVSGEISKGGNIIGDLNKGKKGHVHMRAEDNIHTHPHLGKPSYKNISNSRYDVRNLDGFERSGPSGMSRSYMNSNHTENHIIKTHKDLDLKDKKEYYKKTLSLLNKPSVVKSILRNKSKTIPQVASLRQGISNSGDRVSSGKDFLDKSVRENASIVNRHKDSLVSMHKNIEKRLESHNLNKKLEIVKNRYGKIPYRTPEADLKVAWNNYSKMQRIATPSVNATSSFKHTKNGPRVVYFDHTPKKSKILP